MFHVDHVNVFFFFWGMEWATCPCSARTCTVVMTQARRGGGVRGIGDGAGCVCSLIIIKRQTSLALRILLYIVTFDLCVWPLEQSRPPPPSHLGNDTSLFLFMWGSVAPVWLFLLFCNLKITSQVATAMLPYNETRVLRNRHSNVYQRVCE